MNSRSKSGLFMIELVIVIVVFSFSAAKSLEVFFHSRQIAEQSNNLSRASIEVQTAADCYKSHGGDFISTAEFLNGSVEDNKIMIYYDAKWEKVKNFTEARYCLTITETATLESVITAEDTKGGDLIFSVMVRGGLGLG